MTDSLIKKLIIIIPELYLSYGILSINFFLIYRTKKLVLSQNIKSYQDKNYRKIIKYNKDNDLGLEINININPYLFGLLITNEHNYNEGITPDLLVIPGANYGKVLLYLTGCGDNKFRKFPHISHHKISG